MGIAQIEERNLSLASFLKAELAQVPGVKVVSPMEGPGCSGLVSLTIDGVDPELGADALWESSRVVIRFVRHPPALRASLDFFNTKEEVARLVESVRSLAQT